MLTPDVPQLPGLEGYPAWVAWALPYGAVAFLVAGICALGVWRSSSKWLREWRFPLIAVAALGLCSAGAGGVAHGVWMDHAEDTLVAAIEDTYEIADVARADPGETERPVCFPVEEDSMQYTGTVHGQKITFRVGYDGCGQNPEPDILIEGAASKHLDPDQLKLESAS